MGWVFMLFSGKLDLIQQDIPNGTNRVKDDY